MAITKMRFRTLASREPLCGADVGAHIIRTSYDDYGRIIAEAKIKAE
jgi:hypothetical protein